MHVAHSRVFKGAAIYAGGVYHCAQGNVGTALSNCGGLSNATNGGASYSSTLAPSEQYLDQQSAAGTIDPSSNLAGQPVYLWSGTKDTVVNPLEMVDLNSEYTKYGAKTVFDNAFPAEHGWESPDGELSCATKGLPFMIACASGGQVYDSVKTWLTLFFGHLNPRATGSLTGTLAKFDQTEFGDVASESLDTTGLVYVPQACAAGAPCGFVLAEHGCGTCQAIWCRDIG